MVFKKLDRPDWWGQEYVLQQLELRRGLFEILEEAASRCNISKMTLYGDVCKWRKHEEKFASRYRFLSHKNLGRITRGGAPATVLDEMTTKLFFAEMDRNGGKVGPAAEALGIRPGLIYAKRNPNGKEYDAAFARKVDEFEGSRFGRIRENFLDAAEIDPWLGERALVTGMPHLHNPKRLVEIEGRVKHEHTHHLSEQALAQIQERQQLWRGARPALPESTDDSQVIDVTAVPVRAKA